MGWSPSPRRIFFTSQSLTTQQGKRHGDKRRGQVEDEGIISDLPPSPWTEEEEEGKHKRVGRIWDRISIPLCS